MEAPLTGRRGGETRRRRRRSQRRSGVSWSTTVMTKTRGRARMRATRRVRKQPMSRIVLSR